MLPQSWRPVSGTAQRVVYSAGAGNCALARKPGRAPAYQCMLKPARALVVVTPPLAGFST
jgi:hypothetical protein